jgi:hypothetical protein
VRILTLEGRHDIRRLLPDSWIYVSHLPRLPYLYRGGTELLFERRGPRVSVRRDGQPQRLAGVVADTPDGLAALRGALADGTSPLTIWCYADTVEALPSLPEKGDFTLVVVGGKVADLTAVARHSSLTALGLWASSGPSDLAPLTKLPRLTALHLDPCSDVSSFAPLAKMPNLASLEGLTNLRTLWLYRCDGVSDLRPLARLSGLTFLLLYSCNGKFDLAPVGELSNLTTLLLDECSSVRDLSPLAKLGLLRGVAVRGCGNVTDLSPLRDMVRRGGEVSVDERLSGQLKALRGKDR